MYFALLARWRCLRAEGAEAEEAQRRDSDEGENSGRRGRSRDMAVREGGRERRVIIVSKYKAREGRGE